MRKPLLHIFPIPGIETYNTKFFNKRNMNMICNNKEEIISNCKYLFLHFTTITISRYYTYQNNKRSATLIYVIRYRTR